LAVFGVAVFLCVILIVVSASGILGPAQGLIAVPFSWAQGAISSGISRINTLANQLSNLQSLQDQNTQLEHALVNFQSEIVDLRQIKADYNRVVALLNYKDHSGIAGGQFTTARVIARDTTGLLRSVLIDHGQRDGLNVGMPVVTELGLVGRISAVTAVSAQVTLITDTNSYVNARLQSTNGEGSVVGTASGDLRMTFIKLTDTVNDNDLVVTSGIGGNFPRGLTIGQVTSSRLDDSQLFKSADVRSLIDFNRLDFVMVITNFQPFDLSAFATPTPPQ
jgi:rod shape-determining protein MreC